VLDEDTGAIEYLFDSQVIRFEPDSSSPSGPTPRITLGNASNVVTGAGGVISGGGTNINPNQVIGLLSTISGGAANAANGDKSTISGGEANSALGTQSAIGGGVGNVTAGDTGTIAGGHGNMASGDNSAIGGGLENTASGRESIVGGGEANTAFGSWSTVGGGAENTANGRESVVGGGGGNIADGDWSAVGGGDRNIASGDKSAVVGGFSNAASGQWSTVGGGRGNRAIGVNSTVGGGRDNVAVGIGSTVAGGRTNCAGGDYSWAGGSSAKVRSGEIVTGCANFDVSGDSDGDEGTFIWSDSLNFSLVSSGPDQFLVRATGGIWFGAGGAFASIPSGRFINTSTGAYLSTGGTWTNSSSRALKEGFEVVDPLDVLGRVLRLDVSTWAYRDSPEGRHMGPMAEDFHEAFGLGGDPGSISTVDASGVALAAIQGLNRKFDAKRDVLEAENAALRQRLAEITQRQSETESRHDAELAELRRQQNEAMTALRADLVMLRELVAPRVAEAGGR